MIRSILIWIQRASANPLLPVEMRLAVNKGVIFEYGADPIRT